ncbi:MAG: hypothetical protein RLY86_2476 [Pseudomonadota bacterium]|jgi:iron complex transport system substrate-binding protein
MQPSDGVCRWIGHLSALTRPKGGGGEGRQPAAGPRPLPERWTDGRDDTDSDFKPPAPPRGGTIPHPEREVVMGRIVALATLGAIGLGALGLGALASTGAGGLVTAVTGALRAPAPAPAVIQAGGPPRRVVSLNLCTDQLAVLLLPRERIAGLTFLADDPDLSTVADRVAGIPLVQGQAEEVLALRPDLVLAGIYTTRPTVALLKARGIPVIELGLTDGFDSIRAETRRLAAALGVPERAEELLADMDAALAAAAPAMDAGGDPAAGSNPSALTFAPGGFTAGAGTLSDAVMRAAGLTNYAAAKGMNGYGYLSVETVAADPPDLLIASAQPKDYPSLQDRMLGHPALARAVPAGARPRIPGSLWACGGPFTAEAVTRLAAARTGLTARDRLAGAEP